MLSKEHFELINTAAIKTAEVSEEVKYLAVPAIAITTGYNTAILCLIILVTVLVTGLITYASVKTYLYLTRDPEEKVQLKQQKQLKEVYTFYE